jgi:hypothetical protein
MTRTPFPLPLRNALAELAIAALTADDAAAALAWLTDPARPPSPAAATRLVAVHLLDPGGTALLDVHAPHASAVAEHARRGTRAATARRTRAVTPASPVAHAVEDATVLWDERLFFEVHEVLEAVWQKASGDVRQALQGVIQLAVAFHHLEHGNHRGARSLLVEGRRRLDTVPREVLPGLDVARLRESVTPWETALGAGTVPATELPRLSALG